jgi:hypothetical protein
LVNIPKTGPVGISQPKQKRQKITHHFIIKRIVPVVVMKLEPCAGRATPPPPPTLFHAAAANFFVSARRRRRRRRRLLVGAPPKVRLLSGIFSYCIFLLLDLIAIFFKIRKLQLN